MSSFFKTHKASKAFVVIHIEFFSLTDFMGKNNLFRYYGNIDISVTSAAFVVAMALLVQRGNPRFSQLSSTMFGLFYCGYLPCFWVKLRCGLAAPALNTGKLSPFLLLHTILLICPFNHFSSNYRNWKNMANSSWWSSSLDSRTCGDVDFIQRCNCDRHICFSWWQGKRLTDKIFNYNRSKIGFNYQNCRLLVGHLLLVSVQKRHGKGLLQDLLVV